MALSGTHSLPNLVRSNFSFLQALPANTEEILLSLIRTIIVFRCLIDLAGCGLDLGSMGVENGQLNFPLGVGLLSNGIVVVSEWGGNRLQIFGSRGEFVREIGFGLLENPWHLFVDSDDNILVADSGNNFIQLFYRNGTHIKSIGSGRISSPCGVCMNREGRIIVAEGDEGHRISIF